MTKLFKIGDFCFKIIYPDGVKLPENFMLFECDGGEYQYTYNISIADEAPPIEGRIIARRRDIVVLETDSGESRVIGMTGMPAPYAVYRETDDKTAQITYFSQWLEIFHHDTVFNSLLALERRMINIDSVILHCAYIYHDGKAILFSAPSETGKTTQANLWEQYMGARTINGDRALLRKKDGEWYACGWPVCGSSGVCNNEEYPIHAVVMLSQAKENTAERLSASQAFMQIYTQLTINRWNNRYNDRVIELLEDIVKDIPVFHLGCTISHEAVKCLEKAIY